MFNIDQILTTLKTDQNAQRTAMTGAAGLAAGMLLGRGGFGSLVKVGAVAAIGGLAYSAWKNHQAQQGNTGPVDHDRFIPPAQAGYQQEELSKTLVRAMIAATKADGQIDASEKEAIFKKLETMPLGAVLGALSSADYGVDVEWARQFVEDERFLLGAKRHGLELLEDRFLLGRIDLSVGLGGGDHGAHQRLAQLFLLIAGLRRRNEALMVDRSGVALLRLVVLPGVVGVAANGRDGTNLDQAAETTPAEQHAGRKTRCASHRRALGVLVGLEGRQDLVDVEHGALLVLAPK